MTHTPLDLDELERLSRLESPEGEIKYVRALRNAAPALIAAARERDIWQQRYVRAESLVAQLSDKYNGEPCAEIRWQQERETLRGALTAAQARVKELEKALRPFAKEEGTWLETIRDNYRPGITEPNQKTFHARAKFCLGDLRRAARALGDTK